MDKFDFYFLFFFMYHYSVVQGHKLSSIDFVYQVFDNSMEKEKMMLRHLSFSR